MQAVSVERASPYAAPGTDASAKATVLPQTARVASRSDSTRLRGRVKAFLSALVEKTDNLIAFLAFEKALILRQLAIQSEKNALLPFRAPTTLFIFVISHMFLFYELGRPFAGGISLLNAVLGAFFIWISFKAAYIRAARSNFRKLYNKNLNIKWVHIFIAETTWDVMQMILAGMFTELFSRLVLNQSFVSAFTMPNLPLIAITLGFAVLSGAGLGMFAHSLSVHFPVIAAVDHIFLWLLYVTMGVYTSYVSIPQILQQYFQFNPLLSLTEYTRYALDSSYPVGNLTLSYPFWCVAAVFLLGLAVRKWEREVEAT